MKKIAAISMIMCLLLLCAAACAQTVEPVVPEALRTLLAGKTFKARMDGYGWGTEDMSDAKIVWQICERETYPAEAVEALKEGDTLVVGGDRFVIKTIEQQDWGYDLTSVDGWYDLTLTKNEDGRYWAITDTENSFYTNLFQVEVPVPEDMQFLDQSDPEAEEPTVLTVKDLLERAMNEELHLDETNTTITFDEEGRLMSVHYTYAPWN